MPAAPAHTLADEVVGVYQSLEMWGLLSQPMSVWTDDTHLTHPYDTLSERVAVRLRSDLPVGVCLRSLVVGWSNLGYMKGQLNRPVPSNWVESHSQPHSGRTDLMRYRDHVWKRYGLSGRARAHSDLHVLIMEKNTSGAANPSRINNVAQITSALEAPARARALGLSGEVRVTRASWKGMPMRQQVELVAQADLVISLPGSDLINCVYLPSPAAIVVPWRRCCSSDKFSTGFQPSLEVKLWFDLVPQWYVYQYNPTLDAWHRANTTTSVPAATVNRSDSAAAAVVGIHIDVELLLMRYVRTAIDRLRVDGVIV